MVQARMSPKPSRFHLFAALAPVLLFFFVSGACGLLYQVVWTRQLVLLFGATSHAVSTVLSIFFLGLGAGSLWGGRFADRVRSPLLWYGVFEIVIGLWAAAFLVLVTYGESAVVALLQSFAFSRGAGIGLRAFMALVLLFLPVFLMGATLPLLSRQVSLAGSVAGLRIGILYSLNTFGAVAGCALTGFVLIERLGYTQTTLAGAAANIAIGLLAVAIGRKAALPEETRSTDPAVSEAELSPSTRWLPAVVLAAFTLSGFSTLALEVVWTRLLAIIFLGTTYAYTTMLAVLLCGLALGGMMGAFIADRTKRPALWFAGVLLATGVLALGQLSGFAALPQALIDAAGEGWSGEVRTKFLLAARVLLPPTLALGATFIFAIKALARHGSLGMDVGRIYAFNTFGGVAGSLAGGFLLLPLLGAHLTIVAIGALFCFGGLALVWSAPAGTALRIAFTVATISAAGLTLWRAPEDVNTALNLGYVPARHEVLAVREGTEGTVVVSQPNDEEAGTNRVLWINRVQATASIERGVRMNRLQGVLPHLFDRDVNDVLFMCFGSGVTCGTLALGGFDQIDAVEISPDVLKVAPLFAADNLGVLDRPGVRFHIDDGRNYLLVSEDKYDFITFEPMPLALAGVSSFYTRDYYSLCLDHLAPRGMVSQWVPLHSLSPDVVRSLVTTFLDVFPHYCAWFINADLFLIGSNEPLVLDPEAARQRLNHPELQPALAKVGFHDIEELYGCFIMDEPALRAYASGGDIMRDDRPWAEFIAPKLVYGRTVHETLAELQAHAASPLGLIAESQRGSETAARIDRRQRARIHDFEGLKIYYGEPTISSSAFDEFDASLDIDPDNFNSKYYMKMIGLQQGERLIAWEMWDDAERLLNRALHRMPGDPELGGMMRSLQDKRAQHP
jgi:spermidine synthase